MKNNMTRISPKLMTRLRDAGIKDIDRHLTLQKVYVAHKGICQKCNCKTVLGVFPTVDTSATMEHKIPISHGGSHTWSNVTLLCQSCNFAENHKKTKEVYSAQKKYKKVFSLFGYDFFMLKRSHIVKE